MIKTIATTFISVLLFSIVQAHSINKKDARQLLEKAWGDLKKSDSTAFVNFWSLNDEVSIHQKRPHKKAEIISNFNAMKEYLATALNKNLKIDFIDVDEQKLDGTDTEYWIKAWFKYDEHEYKSFGFYIAYKNEKWIVRDYPSTSTIVHNSTTKKK